MHSSLVGFLNLVLASSAYLGLTNSPMTPLVLSRFTLYSASLKSSWLMFPGYGDQPVFLSFTSPALLTVARRRGSSWLYSTLMVMLSPEEEVRSHTAPTACLALRGMAREFMTRSSSMLTPKKAARVWKPRPLVSWKKTAYSKPMSSHFFGRPFECIREWTSPWPWGLLSIEKGSDSDWAIPPSLFMMAATFSCFMRVTSLTLMPKYLFFLRRARVLS
mmetsp:Transcript_7499/g.14836  ORF Transcript_7499/g.14836 Transcript_7499/m.14836 type:complete len:218 (-) Transcript_7499:626-1279(-)